MARSVEAKITKNNFPRIRSQFPREVSQAIRKATLDTYRESQTTVPVRKDQRKVRGGRLKASGQVKTSEMEGEVSYSVGYAIYVHEGTYKMAARPFLKNALDRQMPGLRAALASLESRLS